MKVKAILSKIRMVFGFSIFLIGYLVSYIGILIGYGSDVADEYLSTKPMGRDGFDSF